MIKRALLSVSDKTHLIPLAQFLSDNNVEILSTGGTAQCLKQEGIDVIEVSDFTKHQEMLHGRVKSLHPKVHGGILARRLEDKEEIAALNIDLIDLVVVNLYPFEQTIASPKCTLTDAIENIDIGGPTMIRAAAKNHQDVLVLVNPDDYQFVIDNFDSLSSEHRLAFAKKAFAHTARYDAVISHYLTHLNESEPEPFPEALTISFTKKQALRYGENPHQKAAFYVDSNAAIGTIATAKQVHGKALSFNNINDANAALECVKEFDDTHHACVIVKHANPCGIALKETQKSAYLRAFASDKTSSFGGIIAFNQPLEEATAKAIIENQFVEVIIAPVIDETVQSIFAEKKNIRLLQTGFWQETVKTYDYKRVNGGLLVQDADSICTGEANLNTVTKRHPSPEELRDLLFAFKACKHVKSNAIVYAKENATVGIGAGQMSRVDSAIIACKKADDANLAIQGSVMASDAFFPFRDSIDTAYKAGVSAIIQPGGSIRDEEVIKACDELGIAMVMTGIRHFNH